MFLSNRSFDFLDHRWLFHFDFQFFQKGFLLSFRFFLFCQSGHLFSLTGPSFLFCLLGSDPSFFSVTLDFLVFFTGEVFDIVEKIPIDLCRNDQDSCNDE